MSPYVIASGHRVWTSKRAKGELLFAQFYYNREAAELIARPWRKKARRQGLRVKVTHRIVRADNVQLEVSVVTVWRRPQPPSESPVGATLQGDMDKLGAALGKLL